MIERFLSYSFYTDAENVVIDWTVGCKFVPPKILWRGAPIVVVSNALWVVNFRGIAITPS